METFNFGSLTESQYNLVRDKLYDSYSKTNVDVLKHITPEVFHEILKDDVFLIIKYLGLFYHISLTPKVNENHFSNLYRAILDAIPDKNNLKRKIIKDTIINKSFGWALEILLNSITREYLYSYNLFQAINSAHNLEVSKILINRLMRFYIGAEMKFSFKKMHYEDYRLCENYIKFKNSNILVGVD